MFGRAIYCRQKNEMVKIFLGGFPPETNELQIVQIVSVYGQVETIKIVRDKISRKSKGYAFLEMKSKADADAVMENLDRTTYMKNELSVKFAVAKEEKPAFQKFNRSAPRNNNNSGNNNNFREKRPRKSM
jgi:RNA recognition motif-containing protein